MPLPLSENRKRFTVQTVITTGAAVLLVLTGVEVYQVCRATSDEAKYGAWLGPVDSWARVLNIERRVPPSIATALHLRMLEDALLEKNERVTDCLLSSGYLTNVQVPFANAAGRRTEAQALLNKATLETPAKWEFSVRNNSVIVLTCRPADAARLIAALESK